MRRLKDIQANLRAPDAPLGAVMQAFNQLAHPFAVVVDAAGRPVGTITDGDVRRAVLKGATLATPVDQVMNRNPLIGRLENAALCQQLLERVSFLPVVGADGVIVEIWFVVGQESRIGAALVMAGGFGRRLGSRTQNDPKPLLAVGDKPILEHILSRLEASGIRNIFIATHYLADRIKSFIDSRDGLLPQLIHEENSLGTAGALSLLPEPIDGPVLVINGDVLTKLDLEALDGYHHTHGHDGTIAVSPYRVPVPYGVIQQDESGVFQRIDEKPTFTYFVAAGIYLLEPEFCRLVPPETRIDMPELLNLGRNAGLKIGLFPIHEYWIDVGRPDDLDAANRDHKAEH